MADAPISRRDLFARSRDVGGLAAFAALLGSRAEAEGEGGSGARDVYTSIGVRPFINARGTYTILSGSTMLPEVRAAMDQAARQYVHLDELTEAIGERLAALTSAEWGLVTSGCAAALTHATAACVAGGNPDLHVRIPDLRGFAKDEVVIPKHSRNVYDAAIRAVGVRVVEATTLAEFEAALGPRTAMVYVLAGPQADKQRADRGGDGAAHAAARRADPRRCGRRDSHDPQRPPAERRDAGRLQRRQVPARAADRRVCCWAARIS